ncbi:MAG: hypothetical protein ACYCST_21280 [Acidimicrobiales bacterium]
MRHAVILAGTGAVGWAAARQLAAADWEVVVITPAPGSTSPLSSRPSPTDRAGGSSTPPTPTAPTAVRSPPSSPVILDTATARQLGYTPVGDYSTTVADEDDCLRLHRT